MAAQDEMQPVHDIGIFDAHCHPTDIMASIERIATMKARVLTVMSTRAQDQDLVLQAAERYPISGADQLGSSGNNAPTFVVPAFGWHPWFSHQMVYDLDDPEEDNGEFDAVRHYRDVLTPVPDDDQFVGMLTPPLSLRRYLRETEERLNRFPLALVGEIGIDRGFRLPQGPSSMTGDVSLKTGGDEGAYTPGSREGRPLTPYKVNMEHQKKILGAQLALAARLKRAVSVHSVQAHGIVFEVLQDLWKNHLRRSKREMKKKRDAEGIVFEDEKVDADDVSVPYPPRICMHSYSGSKDVLKMFLDPRVPAEMFFSFSECINFGGPAVSKAAEVIKAVPDDKILVESDLHCAGEKMDELLEGIVRRVCEIKGWQLEEGARILRRNWERFVFGR